jgi:hypothetical protein
MSKFGMVVCTLAVGLLLTEPAQSGPPRKGPAKRGRLAKGGKRKAARKARRGRRRPPGLARRARRRPGLSARRGRVRPRPPAHALARPARRGRPRGPRLAWDYRPAPRIYPEPQFVEEPPYRKPRKRRPVVRVPTDRRPPRPVFVRGWSKRAEYVQGPDRIDEVRLRGLSRGWHEVATTAYGHRAEVEVKGGKIYGMKFHSESGQEYPARCWKEGDNVCFGGCDPETGKTSCVRWPVKWCADECEPEDGPPADDGENNPAPAPAPKGGQVPDGDGLGQE